METATPTVLRVSLPKAFAEDELRSPGCCHALRFTAAAECTAAKCEPPMTLVKAEDVRVPPRGAEMQPPSPEARATAFPRLKHVPHHTSYLFCVAQCCAGQKHVLRGLGQCAKGEELDRHGFETRTHPSPAVSRVASTSSMAWPRQICANSTCIVQQCVVRSRDTMHTSGIRQGVRQNIRLVQVQTPPSPLCLSSRRGRARSSSR